MSILSISTHFSTEEHIAFKAYLRSKNKRSDTKNIELYTLLRKNTPLKNIDTTLYGKPNRNAYHALSKRLQDSLIDFIATRNIQTETSDDMQVFKWILTSRILYEQDQPKVAQKILKKATQKALELDLYTALTESYHTQWQYSHLHPEVHLEKLTQATNENQQRFLQQEQLNMAYAHIKRSLNFDQALLEKGIQKTVEEILDSFHIIINETFSFKSLYQLLEIINKAAHLDHNFNEALPFIKQTYTLVQQKKVIPEKERFYHIQVLYFMANAFFRVRDFSQASHYLSLMRQSIIIDKGKWESRFRESHLLINSFILNYSGNSRQAIRILEQYLTTLKKQQPNPDLVMALVVFQTQQEEYKKAFSSLNIMKHTDAWYKERFGLDWVIKKDLTTLIIYYELEYIGLTTSLLRSFKRRHKSIIQSEVRLEKFISAFTKIFNTPEIINEERFRESIKTQFTTTSLAQEDIFMISFFAWIKAKLNGSKIYETTIALL